MNEKITKVVKWENKDGTFSDTKEDAIEYNDSLEKKLRIKRELSRFFEMVLEFDKDKINHVVEKVYERGFMLRNLLNINKDCL